MKTKIYLIGILGIILLFSCNSNKKSNNQIDDTLSFLLNKSMLTDTLEYADIEPFLFFKSGNIIDKNQKNAIAVFLTSDTTYTINLYGFEKKKCNLIDKICNIKTTEEIMAFFDIKFKDYNFDNQTDFYIQVVCSNGYSLSRGNLITINPKTKKMKLHDEANDLANLMPDYKTQSVYSAIFNGYDEFDNPGFTVSIHKWENGKLNFLKDKQVSIEEYYEKYSEY